MFNRTHHNRMFKHILIIVTILLGCSALHAQNAQQWRDTLEVLNSQIKQETKYNVDTHLRKAAANLQLQQYDYAINEYTEVLTYSAHNLAALFYRAYAHQNLRHYVLAVNDYQDLLKWTPLHFEARLGLSYVYQKMGDKQRAYDELNTLVEQHPDSASAFVARASFEQEVLKQLSVALYDWQQASALKPGNREYQLSQVNLLIGMKRKQDAIDLLDKMVRGGIPRGSLISYYKKCK